MQEDCSPQPLENKGGSAASLPQVPLTASGAENAEDVPRARMFPTVQKCMNRHWIFFAVIITMFAAYPAPSAGAKINKETSTETVIVLFLLVGLTIDLQRLHRGVVAIHVHVFCQTFNLILMPLAYYFVVYRWSWEIHAGILTQPLSVGVMAAMCMPTTVSTCVLFTRQAQGDEAVAAFNAAGGNLLGPLFAPFMAAHLLGSVVPPQDPVATLAEVAYKILVPLALAVLLQLSLRRWCRTAVINGVVSVAKRMMDLLMVVLFYFIWCMCFEDGKRDLAANTVAAMSLWVTVVHVVFLTLVWLASRGFSWERRIALLFTAPQKTEGMAVAILAVIFGGDRKSVV